MVCWKIHDQLAKGEELAMNWCVFLQALSPGITGPKNEELIEYVYNVTCGQPNKKTTIWGWFIQSIYGFMDIYGEFWDCLLLGLPHCSNQGRISADRIFSTRHPLQQAGELVKQICILASEWHQVSQINSHGFNCYRTNCWGFDARCAKAYMFALNPADTVWFCFFPH